LGQILRNTKYQSSEFKKIISANIEHKMMWLLMQDKISVRTAILWQVRYKKLLTPVRHVKILAKKLASGAGLIKIPSN